jgi:hypothetical protein
MILVEYVVFPLSIWLPLPFLFLGNVILTLAYDSKRRTQSRRARHFWIHWWHAPLLAFFENAFGVYAFLPIALLKTLFFGPVGFTLEESIAYIALCCLVVFAIASLMWIRHQEEKWTAA